MKKSTSGFTIVELLIVIVVIGILATIVLVAYNGASQRAENTKTVNAVAAYANVLSMYATDTGSYPLIRYPCLGPVGTKCANETDSTAACNGAATAGTTTPAFVAALAPYATTIPPPSTQNMLCSGKQYGGAWYDSSDGKSSQIYFYLNGNQQCPTTLLSWTKSSQYQADNTTVCKGTLPTLP